MARIDHVHLAKLDLNLLVALDALLAERSVTRAAAHVGISQSAMSHALARLRATFADELLTRTPHGMQPTPRAVALSETVQTILAHVQQITAPPAAFDPAVAETTFTLGMSDSIEALLMPRLVAWLRAHAPGVKLLLRTVDRNRVLDDLDSGRIDLGIGIFEQGQMHHKRRVLYSESYLCIFNAELLSLQSPVLLEDYLRFPHILTSLVETAYGVVDDALSLIGRERSILLTSPRFIVVPFIVREAPVIATMHARLALSFAGAMGLTVSPVPVALPDVSISMIWHASNDRQHRHRWLRDTIVKLGR